jgi:L-lysine exporter family protein LysE/ArgO
MFIILGIVIGFAAAIPLGPVNVFVVSQTLKHDFFHGFLAGLTTAIMDTLYCLVALVGISHFTFNLTPYLGWMKGGATLLLIMLGVRMIRQSRKPDSPALSENPLIKSTRPVIGVFLLYVSNPTLYAFWIAVAGMATAHNIVGNSGWIPVAFAVACGLGSMIWYMLIVRYVSKHQHKIRPAAFQKMLVFMGIAMIGFALYTFATIFIK